MKKYVKPEVEIIQFGNGDIFLNASGPISLSPTPEEQAIPEDPKHIPAGPLEPENANNMEPAKVSENDNISEPKNDMSTDVEGTVSGGDTTDPIIIDTETPTENTSSEETSSGNTDGATGEIYSDTPANSFYDTPSDEGYATVQETTDSVLTE